MPTAFFVPPEDEPLDLTSSLTSGQCFRWRVDAEGRWTGVLGRDLIRLTPAPNGSISVESAPAPPESAIETLAAYFRIGDELAAVQRRIAWDDRAREGIAAYPGMRVLRQEPWETLAAFILSSTSNMPRISRTVELLAETFGERGALDDGAARRAFPAPAQLAEAGEARLRELGCGFRAPYLAEAAAAVASGRLPLDALRSASYADALAALTSLRGVGDKIADCVMLFALEKTEAFPIDRWALKVLREWYGLPAGVKYAEAREWAQGRFGADAGYANQYLFWLVRQSTRPLRSIATLEPPGTGDKGRRGALRPRPVGAGFPPTRE